MRNARDRRNMIGNPPGFNSPKKKSMIDTTTALGTRSLYAVDIVDIDKTTFHRIDERERQQVTVRGFSLSYAFRNIAGAPLYFNIAIAAARNSNSFPTGDGFFRDYTSSRDVDFSNALTASQFHTLPISSDKWIVLMHRRHEIGGQTGAGYLSQQNWMPMQKQYIKLNRQIVFDDDSSALAEHRVYLFMWCDYMAWPAGSPQTEPGNEPCIGDLRVVTSFSETGV